MIRKCRIPNIESVECISCNDLEEAVESVRNLCDEEDCKVWLNLTNGIEAAQRLDNLCIDYSYMRMQSTSFERKKWHHSLDALPDELLLKLASGQRQIIIDFGANKKCPRALRQGIPIAANIIHRAWKLGDLDRIWIFNRRGEEFLSSMDAEHLYNRAGRSRKSRLKYYKKFLFTDSIKITLICAPTKLDGDYRTHIDQYSNLQ